jgi:cyanophycinase
LITRKRENDLVAVIDAHPELIGVGIDEGTAIVVEGDRFEVIGPSKVAVYDGQDHHGRKYFFLSAGDKYEFNGK